MHSERSPGEAEEGAEEEDEGEVAAEEGESDEARVAEGATEGLHYTADLSDKELAERWKSAPGSLGSVAVGFVEQGRLINAERLPASGDWLVVTPENAWGTQETLAYLTAALRRVRELYPEAPPLRVNQLSAKDGGYLRPHKSHQNGRDVDLGFYYPTAEPVRAKEREKYIDVALNWELVKALVVLTDVQMILVDHRVQKVLYAHALEMGEDKAWLDSLFHAGPHSIVRHARRHRDHFHVRFYNPRAQELGRRIVPLLAQRPEHNVRVHRVRSGDTLGGIALRYGTTISALQKANGLKGSFLRVGQRLQVVARGPCARCPVPPPVVVPPRRLPPDMLQHREPVASRE